MSRHMKQAPASVPGEVHNTKKRALKVMNDNSALVLCLLFVLNSAVAIVQINRMSNFLCAGLVSYEKPGSCQSHLYLFLLLCRHQACLREERGGWVVVDGPKSRWQRFEMNTRSSWKNLSALLLSFFLFRRRSSKTDTCWNWKRTMCHSDFQFSPFFVCAVLANSINAPRYDLTFQTFFTPRRRRCRKFFHISTIKKGERSERARW